MKTQAKTKAFGTLDANPKTFFVFIANQSQRKRETQNPASNRTSNPASNRGLNRTEPDFYLVIDSFNVLQSGSLLIDSLRIFTTTDSSILLARLNLR